MCPGCGRQPVRVVRVDGRPQVLLDPLVRPHVGNVPHGDLTRPVAQAGQVQHYLKYSNALSVVFIRANLEGTVSNIYLCVALI